MAVDVVDNKATATNELSRARNTFCTTPKRMNKENGVKHMCMRQGTLLKFYCTKCRDKHNDKLPSSSNCR